MVRAVDTGVVNVSDLDTQKQRYLFAHDRKRTHQLSLAVQESADKLRTLANLESGSKGEQVLAQEMINKP
jgi:hypothetical protein